MSAKAKNKLTPQQRKATLNRVLHKIRPYSAFVVCSLLVAAVSVAAQLYIPILCGDAIDKMLGKGNVDLAGVLRIAVSILVVAAVAALAQWLLSVCNNRITFSVSRDLRNEALRKISDPAAVLSGQPPFRRYRQPHGGGCGHLCGRPADGLYPAVLRHPDHFLAPCCSCCGRTCPSRWWWCASPR